MRRVRIRQGYASTVDSEANYSSGEDYVVEFLGYRFSFNASDFEQRVTAAAVKLGLLAGTSWTTTRRPTWSSSSSGTRSKSPAARSAATSFATGRRSPSSTARRSSTG